MKSVAAFLIFLGFFLHCDGVVNIDEEKRQLIDEFVESVIFKCPQHSIVSMNLAVVHQGEVAYTTAYGLKDLETGENATEDSVYAIASVSKHFTSLLLGQIMKEGGRFNWNSKLKEILGNDFYFHDLLRTNLSRASDLASHSLGLPRNEAVIWAGQTRAELAQRVRFLPATVDLRTDYNYNNLMYHMLGHLTETISEVEWEELIQNRLFDAVGMRDTVLDYRVEDEDNIDLAKLYKVDAGEFREVDLDIHRAWMGSAGGAGAIMSTANDMARWMLMIVGEGELEGARVVDDDVITQIVTPVNAHVWDPASSDTIRPKTPVTWDTGPYGLGLYKSSYRGMRAFVHGGALDGHYTGLYMLPDVDLGVYMTISGVEGSDTSTPIFAYIADLMLGLDPWLNTTTGCTYPNVNKVWKHDDFKVEKPEMKLPKKPINLDQKYLQQNVGDFGNFGYGNLTISFADDGTTLIMRLGDYFNYRLVPLTPEPDVIFYGQGFEPNWEYAVSPIVFYAEGDFVNVTYSSSEGPITYQRGLLLSDAPEPGFDIC